MCRPQSQIRVTYIHRIRFRDQKNIMYHAVVVKIPRWTNKPSVLKLEPSKTEHGKREARLESEDDVEPNGSVTERRGTNHRGPIMSLDQTSST